MSSSYKFYLAPLRGITDQIFRNTYEKHLGQFDFQIAPFIPTVKGTSVNPSIIRDIDPKNNDICRLIPQIIGNNPLEIRLLATKMCELGYRSINLNLGCPHTPVTRKKRGSGLLPYPDMIKSILDILLPSLNCSISVKLRLGLHNENEIDKVIPVLNDFPLSEIIIHPRTGAQMYEGTINQDAFQRCLELSKHVVVFNGDIFSYDDFKEKCTRFPQIDRWMLGRGIIKNPFLLQTLRTGEQKYQIASLKDFHNEILELNSRFLCGHSHLLNKMKGLWAYMSDSFVDGKRILKKIQKTSSLSSYNELVNKLFEKQSIT